MDNEIIKQTLIESFEVIKDSWQTKKDSIIRCIIETEPIDGDLAMDMWCYILKNNKSLIVGNIGNVKFIDDIVLKFNEKYNGTCITPYYICKTILNHIAPHFVKNNDLIKTIFSSLHNAGYSRHSYSEIEILPLLIACLFFQNSPQAIPVIIQSMASNKNMEEIRIGELIIKSNTYIDGIQNHWAWHVGEHHISDMVKESLLNCLDLIKNNEDRAEIMLSLMAR